MSDPAPPPAATPWPAAAAPPPAAGPPAGAPPRDPAVPPDLVVPPALTDLGWPPDRPLPPGVRPGRVVRVDRGGAEVATATGTVTVPARPDLVVGDWVELTAAYDAVQGVLPRRTAVVRASSAGHSRGQVLAAGVDLVGVVSALPDVPHLARIERYLTLAWESGARPLVVLTKADLVTAEELRWSRSRVAAVAPGAEVVAVSTVSTLSTVSTAATLSTPSIVPTLSTARTAASGSAGGAGVGELAAAVAPGRTLVLLGPSGSGKSSLVNALLGVDRLAVQAVRAVDGKGRHTTTARELVVLPGGGVLIDTPGLRGVGLAGAADALERTFPDVVELAAGCRFGDCSHRVEPGCAVLAAVEDGELPVRRLESWRKLGREAEAAAARTDARRAAERRRRWKELARAQRAARPR